MIQTAGAFSRDELLQYFAEAFNAARRHISSPGTRDLEVKEWEPLFCKIESEILPCINDIDNIQKLKEYFEKLSIEWANEMFRKSLSEALNYKK